MQKTISQCGCVHSLNRQNLIFVGMKTKQVLESSLVHTNKAKEVWLCISLRLQRAFQHSADDNSDFCFCSVFRFITKQLMVLKEMRSNEKGTSGEL